MDKLRILARALAWFTGIVITLLLILGGCLYLFKDKIIAATIGEVNKYLNTKVEISEDIELSLLDKFPQVYIKFKDVKIYEAIPGSKNKLGELKQIYLTFDIFEIFRSNYHFDELYLENGKVYLRVDENGQNNYSIIKSGKDTGVSSDNVSFNFHKIVLNDVFVRYENRITHQDHQVLSENIAARLEAKNNNYHISLTGDLHIHAIHINNYEYFREKDISLNSEMYYQQSDSTFRIMPSSLQVQEALFSIEGKYEFKHSNTIDLRVKAGKSDIQTLISLLPRSAEQSLNTYKSDGEVYFDATIKGPISDVENPSIDINFGFVKAFFYHPNIPDRIEYANLNGSFSNGEHRKASSWTLSLNNISAFFHHKKITGAFYMKNFDHPFIRAKMEGVFDVKSLLDFYPIEGVSNASGSIDINAEFEGYLEDLQHKERQQNVNTSGQVSFTDLNFKKAGFPYSFSNFNGLFIFNKNDIGITNFSGRLGKSNFLINGTFKNVFSKLIYDKGSMAIDATLESSYLDAAELIEKDSAKAGNTSSGGTLALPPGYIVLLKCDIKKLSYGRFQTSDFKGNLKYSSPYLKLENLHFKTAGGKMEMDSRIEFTRENVIQSSTKASFTNIKIDTIFYMFDNFGQTFIIDKHLRGQFTGKVDLSINIDHQLNIDTKSVLLEAEVNIKNGQLVEFEPMKAITDYFEKLKIPYFSKYFREMELHNIRFSEIKNKIYIQNETIMIPEMEIKSDKPTILISGTHTFSQQMDYKLCIPLKNFKKESVDSDEVFGAIEEKGGGGANIYLTIKGTSDNYKIALDSKRTRTKFKDDLNKEKEELRNILKKKEQETTPAPVELQEEEYFDF